MPLRGSNHSESVRDEDAYFTSLVDLDVWASKSPPKLAGVLPYRPRYSTDTKTSNNTGKLLVCHDYKGGYTETPSSRAYTFNFWSYCDTFIYFSHHRVTIPPSGWTTAAHRHGVKMLGTLIFEGSGEEDCLRLLVGRLPQSKTGPVFPSDVIYLPLSAHYARILADLAFQRGFDGYLLNFECPLRGGVEQTRTLAGWITLLEVELKRKVGVHAQVVWYDSIIINGQLRWQDRLNALNLPFFVPSSAFFTNYTWPPNYPNLTAQYFLSLEASHISRPKSLNDIYVGVDVWGRGSHGGGGFASYKAISHIDPQSLGLSVALFGPAWSWESEQDKPGWSWSEWWTYERKLWVGPANPSDIIEVPAPPPKQPECPHGPFLPICSFFSCLPPPDPLELPFFTSFSPGIGNEWFVGGVRVLGTQSGWTDLDKNCSLGDLVWPRPTLLWEHGERSEALPIVYPELCMDDAWLGGSSLRLSFTVTGSNEDDAFFRCVWVPVQSLAITARKSYEMALVYKIECEGADLDLGLSVKPLGDDVQAIIDVETVSLDSAELTGGWTKMVIQFIAESDMPAAVGLIVGIALDDPSQCFDFSLRLGRLSVYPSPLRQDLTPYRPKIVWADFQPCISSPRARSPLEGVVTWDVGGFFATSTNRTLTSMEDPQPAWRLDTNFPTFIYFNIYIQAHSQDGTVPGPDTATFIGTTGLDGRENRFFVDIACLPIALENARNVRFYVQGITNDGEILPWEQCAYVDVKL